MKDTLAELKRGERALISDTSSNEIPLKLLEMGCLPGSEVSLVAVRQFSDPMYLNISGTHVAIRKETAKHVLIEKIGHE